MTTLNDRLARVTTDDLRRIGSEKWTTYPGKLGAFVAEMDFGLAPTVEQAVSEAVARGLTGYLPLPLHERTSIVTSEYLQRSYGWRVDPSQIRPVIDVIEAYQRCLDFFTPSTKRVIVPTPAYPPLLQVAKLSGMEVIEVPMVHHEETWRLPLDEISRHLSEAPGLVVLCAPHNPTGSLPSRAELVALSEIVDRTNSRVFSDEIHAPIVFAPARHLPYASVNDLAANHTLTAISASKAWNTAGLKFAQVVLTNAADVRTWEKRAFRSELAPSVLGAVATIAAYESGGAWLEEVLEYLAGNRRLVSERLRDVAGLRVYDAAASYFAWIDCTDLSVPGNVCDFFREHRGIALSDGTNFGAVGERHVRLNFATPRQILEEMLDSFQS